MKKYNVRNGETEEILDDMPGSDEGSLEASGLDSLQDAAPEPEPAKTGEETSKTVSLEPEYEDFEDTLQENLSLNQRDNAPGLEENLNEISAGDEDDLNEISEDEEEDGADARPRKKQEKGTGGFGAFFVEVIQNIQAAFSRNSKLAMTIAGAVVLLVVVVFVILGLAGKRGTKELTESLSNNDAAADASSSSGLIEVPTDPLEQDAYPEVNALIQEYFEARKNNDSETLTRIRNFSSIDLLKIEQLSQYVESYDNITCYTKQGPFDGSYIVYVCYDVKIKNWDVAAPSELTLLVCTDEDGGLYIYSGDMDQNVADYIVNISSQDDVVDLITRVNTEYNDVMDANSDFATYIEAMNQTIKESVGEQLAAAETSESENEVAEEAETAEDTEEASATEEETQPSQVKANTTVNVRASDSEQADKLGKVEAGTVLECKQQKQNGWTEVVYNGQSGYIKSEYLSVVGAESSADLPETNGTVTAKDTVNIRSSADVNGSKIGIAYAGESFGFVKKDGEWTEIIYNGQVAYVKTEYVE